MKKVLLINDDPDFQYLIKNFLERKGFVAKTIYETENVVHMVKEFDPHVIIIDMKIETDKAICNEIREKVKTPAKIVLLTDKGIQLSAMHTCKPDAVIQKPFQPEELIEKILK